MLGSIGQGALVLALLAAVAGVACLSWVGRRRRIQQIEREARSHGWSYQDEDASLVREWTGEPFEAGANRRATNVVVGTDQGRRFVVFDYSYVVQRTGGSPLGSVNPSTDRRHFVVTVVALPVALPMLEVTPDSLVFRIASGVGLVQDINVESDAFNQRFRVRSQSAKFASDVLHPRQIEQLLAGPERPWRIEGGSILAWRDGELEAAQLAEDLPLLAGVIDRVPRFVWVDRGYDPGDGRTDERRSEP